jgi:hypothetical protein
MHHDDREDGFQVSALKRGPGTMAQRCRPPANHDLAQYFLTPFYPW